MIFFDSYLLKPLRCRFLKKISLNSCRFSSYSSLLRINDRYPSISIHFLQQLIGSFSHHLIKSGRQLLHHIQSVPLSKFLDCLLLQIQFVSDLALPCYLSTRITWLSNPSRLLSSIAYASQSVIACCATPLSMAAFATAGQQLKANADQAVWE